MSFTLPQFNISVNIWRTGVAVTNPPSVISRANLAWGHRVMPATGGTGNFGVIAMTLLLPIGTDVRMELQFTGGDVVEAPAGSKRYYYVKYVDDIGYSFDNQHRAALIVRPEFFPVGQAPLWPVPYP